MQEDTTRYDICIVGGAGHVGLPLGLVFAVHGQRVLIHDLNERAMQAIRGGTMPFLEHGAEPLLQEALKNDHLGFSSDPACLSQADTIILTIGTPVDEFLSPDTKILRRWVEEAIPHLRDGQLLVLRSTLYPGSTQWLHTRLREAGLHLRIAFCPERIVQGHAVEELQTLTQIIGGVDAASTDAAVALFRRIAPDVALLPPMEAELAKLFTNAYRYIHFAAANQFYMIADAAGADYARILAALKHNYDRAAHIPGAGFAAGPCLLKDTMQLAAFAENHFPLGNAAMLVNEGLVLYIVGALRRAHDLAAMRVGLLGMAFKGECDDIRSSLSYKLKKNLQLHAKDVLTTDPYVSTAVDPALLPLDEVLARSDLLILCVPHKTYAAIDVGTKPVADIWDFYKHGSRVS